MRCAVPVTAPLLRDRLACSRPTSVAIDQAVENSTLGSVRRFEQGFGLLPTCGRCRRPPNTLVRGTDELRPSSSCLVFRVRAEGIALPAPAHVEILHVRH